MGKKTHCRFQGSIFNILEYCSVLLKCIFTVILSEICGTRRKVSAEITSFKLALQIEEFHCWNWEIVLNIFCRDCGSLLRPLLWVWRVCFQVWICEDCCAGQGRGWWLVPIINSCLGWWKNRMNNLIVFKCFPSLSPFRNLGNSCSHKYGFYVSNYPERISVQRQLFMFEDT